jgi:hypothetical protein
MRRKLDFSAVHGLLTLLALVLAGFYLTSLASFVIRQPWASYRSILSEPALGPAAAPIPAGSPDIYYVILDGYGRADVLDVLYGYDDSSFVSALQARGFFVAAASQANYSRTVLSLASSLNMQYLDQASEAMGDSELWWPVEPAIHHSQVRGFLEGAGYRTVFLASGFDYTDIRDGDFYLKPFPLMLNDFEEAFFRFTNLSAFQGPTSRWISQFSVEAQRQIVLNGFSSLAEAASIPGPKFGFVHIIAPHPPFVFDRNGDLPQNGANTAFLGDADEFQGDPAQYRDGYLAQLEFVNARVLAAIDDILASSSVPPVIIIQADHGPGLYTDFDSAADTCLWERYSILNAYYLPGVQPGAVPTDIGPVNSFRLVLNQYFGAQLEMLPERSYFSGRSHFYQFTDVTAQAERPCGEPVVPPGGSD